MNVRTLIACAVSAAIGAAATAGSTVLFAQTEEQPCQATLNGRVVTVDLDTCEPLPTTSLPTSTTTEPPATTTTDAPTTTTAAPATTAAPTTTEAPTTTAAATTTPSTAPSTTSTMPPMHMACPGIPDTTPIGAVPPALPMLCDKLSSGVPSTFSNGTNSWLDDFDHGAAMSDMGVGYKMFERAQLSGASKSATFRHNNHWMVDVFAAGGGAAAVGGSTMRPDRSFKFENGKLVVETDVAASIAEYENQATMFSAWPEVTVSTASSPVGFTYGPTPGQSTDDNLYAYGRFGGYDTVGVRLTGSNPITALYDTTKRGFPCGRVWELSWFQDGTGQCNPDKNAVITNYPWNHVRSCSGTDPDVQCRDRFRWELTQDKITLYANGFKLIEFTAVAGQHLLPDSIVNGDVYVYFSDTVYRAPSDKVIRFHWDRVAVNGGLLTSAPTPSPTCTPQFRC